MGDTDTARPPLDVYHKHGILLNNALDVADSLRAAIEAGDPQ